MIKIHTVLLSVALTTPFGLAIYDDFFTDKQHVDSQAVREAQEGQVLLDGFGQEPPAEGEGLVADDPAMLVDRGIEERDVDEEEMARTPDEAALRQLFGQERATLGPALGRVRFGMTSAEIGEIAPEVKDWSTREDELGKARVNLEYLARSETRLTAIRIEIDDAGSAAEELLGRLWGEPQMTASDGAAIWVNDAAGMRASMRRMGQVLAVELSQSMTLEDLLGLDRESKLFGFERGKRLVGATIEQVQKLHDRVTVDSFYREYATLDLPGISMDPGGRSVTKVLMTLANGKVVKLDFSVGCGERCDEAMDMFQEKFGEPATGSGEYPTHVFGSSPRIMVRISRQADPSLEVEVLP